MDSPEYLEERIKRLESELSQIRSQNNSFLDFYDNLNANNEFFIRLSSLDSIEKIAAQSIGMLKNIVYFEKGIFLSYNSVADKYEPRAGEKSLYEDSLWQDFFSRDVIEWVFAQNKPVIMPVDEEELLAKGLQNVLYLPLSFANTPVGLFVMFSSSDFLNYNVEQNKLLQIIRSQISMAVENFQLLDTVSGVKDFMKDVMENMINGIITVDMHKHITYMNRNAQFMLNVSNAEVINRNYNDIFSEELINIIEDVIEQISFNGNVIDYEFEQKLSDNTTIPIGVSASILRNRDFGSTGYILIFRDLSLTREIIKLKELDALKNDFISKVSHELRTPLTSISSYTDALLDGMADTKEELDSYLRIIQEECGRLINMVNDVLDVSKMESGKMNFNFADLNINHLILSCINTMNPAAKKKNIKISYREEENIIIRADMDKFTQLLLNLLSNSIKYTPEGGEISIKVTDQQSKVKMAVEDNGVGMRKEDLEKIFDRFYQIENIKHHQKGTGLGMSICKEIAQNQGGKIWVTSELGKGTIVFVTIPKGEAHGNEG